MLVEEDFTDPTLVSLFCSCWAHTGVHEPRLHTRDIAEVHISQPAAPAPAATPPPTGHHPGLLSLYSTPTAATAVSRLKRQRTCHSLQTSRMEKTLPLHATGKEHHQHQQWRASLDALWASHKIPIILLYYGLASSTLIVINKLAVHTVRAPVFILAAQLLFAAGVVRGSAAVGLVEVEPLRWSLVKPFTLIILGFLGTLYSNIKVRTQGWPGGCAPRHCIHTAEQHKCADSRQRVHVQLKAHRASATVVPPAASHQPTV